MFHTRQCHSFSMHLGDGCCDRTQFVGDSPMATTAGTARCRIVLHRRCCVCFQKFSHLSPAISDETVLVASLSPNMPCDCVVEPAHTGGMARSSSGQQLLSTHCDHMTALHSQQPVAVSVYVLWPSAAKCACSHARFIGNLQSTLSCMPPLTQAGLLQHPNELLLCRCPGRLVQVLAVCH
jgi:hypothetical protein